LVYDSFLDYLDQFREFVADHSLRLKLKVGLEVDFIRGYEDKLRRLVEQEDNWGILLCAVHEFDELGGIERPGLPQDREASSDRWRRYIQTQLEALESKYIQFEVLANPVRLVASTPVYPENIDELLRDLASAAKERGVALELNGRDTSYDWALVEKLAQGCKASNCPVSLGSDAHYAEDVYRNNEKAKELVKRYDLQEIHD
jgi:histidinol phosphatase-like PHP family hydrolase